MSRSFQTTISEKVSCTGIGLHSGAPAQLTLHPARSDTGVVFLRTDCGVPVEVPAISSEVSSTALATTLGHTEASVATVEHLMSALYGLGVDNVRVEVDGPELPVMDGSAASFVYLIRSAGIFEQRARRRTLQIRRPIEIVDGERSISIEPCRDFRVDYTIDFEHPAIARQEMAIESLNPETFEREISAARTFGFLADAKRLWEAGFGLGATMDSVVLLDDERVVNPDGLRWADEFVRHKILDLCGDLALLGVAVQGHVRVERGGHALHQQLVRAIIDSPDARTLSDPDVGFGRGLGIARAAAAARA